MPHLIALSDNGVLALMVAVPIGLLVFVMVMMARAAAARERYRQARIWAKYGNTETAQRIIDKTIWQGETDAQLRDSLGAPTDIDQKVLKTKSKAIWKYHHRGGNRYGLRITVENGMVVGWDEKL